MACCLLFEYLLLSHKFYFLHKNEKGLLDVTLEVSIMYPHLHQKRALLLRSAVFEGGQNIIYPQSPEVSRVTSLFLITLCSK